MTVSEALAEIKTLTKRIADKQDFIHKSLGRPEYARDPFAEQGGARSALNAAFQSLRDLEERLAGLRMSILASNMKTTVTIGKITATIQRWLTLRREVLPQRRQFIQKLLDEIQNTRANAQRQGNQVVRDGTPARPTDLLLHVDEIALFTEREEIDTILWDLDGRLSQSNATTQV